MVEREAPPHFAHLVDCKTAERFAADLRWLSRRYQFVGYDDVANAVGGGPALPSRAALLTFDDGYAEIATVVRPIVRRFGIAPISFLPTSVLDNESLSDDARASLCVDQMLRGEPGTWPSLLEETGARGIDLSHPEWPVAYRRLLVAESEALSRTWRHWGLDEQEYLRRAKPYLRRDQVVTMSAEGFCFGGHGTVHRRLQALPREELERDIVTSCSEVAALTGRESVPFAFPFTGGGIRRDWLDQIRRDHGEVGLFFDVGGFRREGDLVWHRFDADSPQEPMAATMRRGYLRAILRR